MATTLRELTVLLGFDVAPGSEKAAKKIEQAENDVTEAAKKLEKAIEKTSEAMGEATAKTKELEKSTKKEEKAAKAAKDEKKKVIPVLERLSKAMETARGKMGDARSALGDLATWMARVAGAASLLGGALFGVTALTAEDTKAIERQSMVLGMTTDAYQEYRAVLNAFGVDASDMTDMFAQITQATVDAARGGKATTEAFNDLGISVKSLKGLSPEGVFDAIADGAARTGDDKKRINALSSLLGEDSFKKAAPLLAQGAEGINKLKLRAREYGLVLSEGAIKEGKRFSASLTDIKMIATGLKNELAVGLMPIMTEIVKSISDWYDANKEVIRQDLQRFIIRATRAFRWFKDSIKATEERLRPFIERLGGMAGILTILVGLVGAFTAAFAAFKVGSAIFALYGALAAIAAALGVGIGPLLGILAAAAVQLALFAGWVSVVYIALEDLFYFISGKNSLIGELIKQFEQSDGPLGNFARRTRSILELMRELLNLMRATGEYVGTRMSQHFQWLADKIRPLVEEYLPKLAELMGSLTKPWDEVTSMIDSLSSFVARGAAGIDAETARLNGAPPMASLPMIPPVVVARTAAQGTRSTTNTTVNNGGAVSIQVNGAGDPKAVAEEVSRKLAAQRRAAADNLRGGDR